MVQKRKEVFMKIRMSMISMMILVSSVLLYCAPNNRHNNNNNDDKYDNAENILNDPSLSLTAKQKSAISACITKHRTEGAEINRKMAAINRQIGEEMRMYVATGKAIDKDKIKKLIIEKKMLEAEMEYLTVMTDIEILSHLEEKQLKSLEERRIKNRPREQQ